MCKDKLASVNEARKGHEARLVEEIQLAKKRLFAEIERGFGEFEEELNFIMDEKEREMVGLVIRVEELVDPLVQEMEGTMFRLRQADTCLESLIHYYYYRSERLQDWDHSLLSAN